MLSLTILYENINDLSSKADRHLATKGCKTKGHIKFQLRATLFVLNVWDWLVCNCLFMMKVKQVYFLSFEFQSVHSLTHCDDSKSNENSKALHLSRFYWE